MKVVIPGGTGQVGTALGRVLRGDGHQVVVLTRQPAGEGQVSWDGERLGPWAREVDGSDVVINLAGRSVSCRYTKENLTAMMRSRVRSARVVGQAIAAAGLPPRAWLQMSTATIYAHTHGTANDDVTGVIGGASWPGRSTSPPPGPCGSVISCGSCGPPGASPSGFRPPGGWRSSAHLRSAPTPSSCSRAGESSPAC